ncbi:hypothetical protein CHU98_g2325 [Xylaria longipes]|nr:hypothetical protein CHU98_g2325 [Xylaria longipes]
MASDISVTNWYAIGGSSLLATLLLFRVHQAYGSVLRFWLNRHLFYPLLVYDVTRLQALLLVVYVSANGLVLALFPGNHPSLEQRAALVSTLNIVTVFLGGRTNPLIDMANVSLQTYYFWHIWAGRVILVEGLLHAGIRIAHQASRTDSLAVSGWIVSLLFLFLLIGSLPIFRRWSYATFIKVHLVLALATLAGLIWHVLTRSLFSKAPVFIAAVLWALSATYRILLRLKWRRGKKLDKDEVNEHLLSLTLGKPLRPYPGMYFYFYFSGLPIRYRFNGYEMADRTALPSAGQRSPTHWPSAPGLLDRRSIREGLRAERYETVILIAEGAGIAGVLPYAVHIAHRRDHDRELKKDNTPIHSSDKYRDVTRRFDLVWKLENKDNELLCKDQIEALMRMDSKMLDVDFAEAEFVPEVKKTAAALRLEANSVGPAFTTEVNAEGPASTAEIRKTKALLKQNDKKADVIRNLINHGIEVPRIDAVQQAPLRENEGDRPQGDDAARSPTGENTGSVSASSTVRQGTRSHPLTVASQSKEEKEVIVSMKIPNLLELLPPFPIVTKEVLVAMALVAMIKEAVVAVAENPKTNGWKRKWFGENGLSQIEDAFAKAALDAFKEGKGCSSGDSDDSDKGPSPQPPPGGTGNSNDNNERPSPQPLPPGGQGGAGSSNDNNPGPSPQPPLGPPGASLPPPPPGPSGANPNRPQGWNPKGLFLLMVEYAGDPKNRCSYGAVLPVDKYAKERDEFLQWQRRVKFSFETYHGVLADLQGLEFKHIDLPNTIAFCSLLTDPKLKYEIQERQATQAQFNEDWKNNRGVYRERFKAAQPAPDFQIQSQAEPDPGQPPGQPSKQPLPFLDLGKISWLYPGWSGPNPGQPPALVQPPWSSRWSMANPWQPQMSYPEKPKNEQH